MNKTAKASTRNAATQLTLAVLALTMTQICLETYKPDPDTYMAEQCANLQRHLDGASEQTKHKKLSAGASRALDRVIEHIAPYIEHDKNLDGNALFAR